MKFSYSKKKKVPFIITVALTLCMLVGVFAPTVMAAPGDFSASAIENTEKKEINYVSIGDSMANGYGFDGYKQDSNDLAVYNPMGADKKNSDKGTDYGLNMYGAGAYPLQFEKYLEDKGYIVNHTKLAVSAMMPEDFLYLLGGRDSEVDDNYGGYRYYIGSYSYRPDYDSRVPEFRAHIQKSVAEADVITLGLGNANFGAFLMDKITKALGILGLTLGDEDKKLTLEYALKCADIDEADRAEIINFVEDIISREELVQSFVEYGFSDEDAINAINIIEYTFASFIINYRLVVEQILKMNPDVEIVFVGLLNIMYGMEITVDDDPNNNIRLGDMMDDIFDALKNYIELVPLFIEADKIAPEASFYYAEQPEPKFICQVIPELKESNWGMIDNGRLSGTTVRSRNIASYNDDLRPMLSAAFSSALGGYELPRIDLALVQAVDAGDYGYLGQYGAYAELYVISAQIYLGIEDAVVECINVNDIPLDSIHSMINGLDRVFAGFVPTADLRGSLADFLIHNQAGLCKVYAMFKVGNGMSLHPTPAGHDKIFATLVHAMPIEYDSQTCALRDVYYYLYRNGYITFGEALELFTTEMTTFELLDTLYNTILIENAVSDDERIEIIGKVYTILKGDSHNVFVSFADLVFGIYRKLVAADLLNNTEAFNIVDFVYGRIIDLTVDEQDIYAIATYIYKTLFFTEGEMVVSLAADFSELDKYDTALSVKEKIEIINIVFGELENSEFVEEAPELAPVLDLYTELKNDEKIGDEALVAVFDIAFEAVAEKTVKGEEVNTEELVAEVTTELATTDKIDLATKAAIVNKVAEVVKNSNLGETTETPVLPEIPDLTKIVGVLDRLDDKYITMDEANELLGKVIELFMKGELNEDTAVVLVKEAYNVVLADLSDEEKVEFIPALYEAIKAEYDLTDEEIFEKHVIIAPSIELFINLRTNNNISDEAILGVLRIALKMISKDDIIGIEDVNAFISQLREQISEDDTFSIEEKIAIIREINIAFPDSVPPEDLAVDIIAKNVSYSEMVQIIFAVDDTSAYGRDVEVLYYLEDPALNPKAKAYKGSYCALGYTAKDGTVYPAFYTVGFPAKNIDNKIYARAHIVGTGVYSDVVEYSVVEYLLERLYLDDITEDQKDLYVKLLEYGAAAQKLLLGMQSNLCTDYVLVNIDGGTIDGKDSQGIYFIGDTVRPYAEGVATWKVTTYNATTGSIETRTISNGATVTINGFTTITSHSAVVAYTPILPDSILPFNSKELLFSV